MSEVSNLTIGNGAEVEIVAMFEEHGRSVLAKNMEFMMLLELGTEPIRAAEVVVEEIAMAAGGNGHGLTNCY